MAVIVHAAQRTRGRGYVLSACCRIGLLLVGGAWSAVMTLVRSIRVPRFPDRPARRADLVEHARAHLATAFGVHRALDAAGALLGHSLRLRSSLPRPAHSIGVCDHFSFALVGVAVIVLFVENAAEPMTAAPRRHPRRASWRRCPPAVRGPLITACVLELATVSDAFVYLLLQRHAQFGAQVFPLLAAATAVSYVSSRFLPAESPTALAAGRSSFPTCVGSGRVCDAVAVKCGRVLSRCVRGVAGELYAMTDGVLAAARARFSRLRSAEPG